MNRELIKLIENWVKGIDAHTYWQTSSYDLHQRFLSENPLIDVSLEEFRTLLNWIAF